MLRRGGRTAAPLNTPLCIGIFSYLVSTLNFMFQTSQYTYGVLGGHQGEYILLVGGHYNSMETLSIDNNTVPPKYGALPVSDPYASRAAVLNGYTLSCGGGERGDDMKWCFRTKSGLEWNEAPDLKVSVD